MFIRPRNVLNAPKDAVVSPVRLEPADDAYHKLVRRDAERGPDIGHRTFVDVDAGRQKDGPLGRERKALGVLANEPRAVGGKAVGPCEKAAHRETRVQTVPLMVGPDEDRAVAAAEEGEGRQRVIVRQVGVDDIDLMFLRVPADRAYVEQPIPHGKISVEP